MTTTALMTDKYEYTMLQATLEDGTAYKQSVFEAFTRRLPAGREYGVVAGLERILEAVENFTFDEETLAYLAEEGLNETTIKYLRNFKFTGTINAYPEGEFYFPGSPLVQIIAPFGEAVLLETLILSILNYDCSVASAASRMVQASDSAALVELGGRRAHEKAAVAAARAAYIAGFAGTSNLEAGKKYGVPVYGTSAHAFTLAHADELTAFKTQVKSLGTDTTLLVDTYDIPQGIRNAVEAGGKSLGAIRIDSGDIREETIKARALLDSLGATKTKIVVSGDLDEYELTKLQGAPVDIAGVGTRVVTGSGHPTASMVYKLVAIEDAPGQWRNVEKKSENKASTGGKKNVLREAGKLYAQEPCAADNASVHNTTEYEIPAAKGAAYSPFATVFKNGKRLDGTTLDKTREMHQKLVSYIK